jgi:hypothetical protein
MDLHHLGKLDPDAHQSWKLDPDPNRHQSEKQDPDLDEHQSKDVEALAAYFGALDCPNLGKSES